MAVSGAGSSGSDGWTRAALVVGGVARHDDQVLLVHERTLGGAGPDQWVLPGGRVEPGELLDEAVRREVAEETGTQVAVGGLAFGTQHYRPGENQPLLYLAFEVELADPDAALHPDDPDGLIIEAAFVRVSEAITMLRAAELTPGNHSTAEFLALPAGTPPPFWVWDLGRSTAGPISRIPTTSRGAGARQ
jgi:8-oxo-dGTP diphosphatase